MKTILLVEDDADIRELVRRVLEGEGYRVFEAENGRDALEQLNTVHEEPCLVLLDLMMPVMSGPELLQAMQRNHRFASLPVVALSAGGKPSDAPSASKFIRKPAPSNLLLAVVREFCGAPSDA